ncbi:MAG: hypothetical protein GXO45_02485 [Aquificae bacterium]|nr:hypothetical protein [Aquificota bacterium]
MGKAETLLEKLKEKLLEEKEILIKSVKDTNLADKLMEVVEEKRKILYEISQMDREEFEGLEEKILEIKQLSDTNLNLAVANAHFIEEIFSAIFEEPQKYDQSGTIQQNQKGLFNKKI